MTQQYISILVNTVATCPSQDGIPSQEILFIRIPLWHVVHCFCVVLVVFGNVHPSKLSIQVFFLHCKCSFPTFFRSCKVFFFDKNGVLHSILFFCYHKTAGNTVLKILMYCFLTISFY